MKIGICYIFNYKLKEFPCPRSNEEVICNVPTNTLAVQLPNTSAEPPPSYSEVFNEPVLYFVHPVNNGDGNVPEQQDFIAEEEEGHDDELPCYSDVFGTAAEYVINPTDATAVEFESTLTDV